MLCPWLYSSSCKHSHHWKYVCKSQNPHQPHAETDSFMKNGGLIGSLLGSSLSLVRWSSSMLICVQGSKWKRGMMRIEKLRFFYREIKMKKAKCFCKFEKPGILLTWPNYLYFPFFLFSKKSLKNSSKLPLPTLLLVLPLIISNAPAAIRAEPRG